MTGFILSNGHLVCSASLRNGCAFLGNPNGWCSGTTCRHRCCRRVSGYRNFHPDGLALVTPHHGFSSADRGRVAPSEIERSDFLLPLTDDYPKGHVRKAYAWLPGVRRVVGAGGSGPWAALAAHMGVIYTTGFADFWRDLALAA